MIERKQQAKEIEEKEQDKTVVIDGLYTWNIFLLNVSKEAKFNAQDYVLYCLP